MQNFLITAKLVLSLLPAILEAVRAIEQALPEGGLGQQKLALIRQAVVGAAEATGDSLKAVEQAWPAIQSTVGAVVGLFNTVGAFKK